MSRPRAAVSLPPRFPGAGAFPRPPPAGSLAAASPSWRPSSFLFDVTGLSLSLLSPAAAALFCNLRCVPLVIREAPGTGQPQLPPGEIALRFTTAGSWFSLLPAASLAGSLFLACGRKRGKKNKKIRIALTLCKPFLPPLASLLRVFCTPRARRKSVLFFLREQEAKTSNWRIKF